MRNLFLAFFGLIAINSFGQLNYQQFGTDFAGGYQPNHIEYSYADDDIYMAFKNYSANQIYLQHFDGLYWTSAYPLPYVANDGFAPIMKFNHLTDTLYFAYAQEDDSLVLKIEHNGMWTHRSIAVDATDILMTLDDSTNTPYFLTTDGFGFNFFEYDPVLDTLIEHIAPTDIVYPLMPNIDFLVNPINGDIYLGYFSTSGITVRRWTGSSWQLLIPNLTDVIPEDNVHVKFGFDGINNDLYMTYAYRVNLFNYKGVKRMDCDTYSQFVLEPLTNFGDGHDLYIRDAAYNDSTQTFVYYHDQHHDYFVFCTDSECSDTLYINHATNSFDLTNFTYHNNDDLYWFGDDNVYYLSGVTAGLDNYYESETQLYPNPASTEINIIAESNSTIFLLNGLGQEVYSDQQSKTTFNIDVSNLKVGIYFLKIKDEFGSVSLEKIIIQ